MTEFSEDELSEDELSEARNILRGLDSIGPGLTKHDKIIFIARVIHEAALKSYRTGYANARLVWGEMKW